MVIMKPHIFWRDMEFLKERFVARGSEKRSSKTPLSQAKGTTHQSIELDIMHIIVN